MHGAEPEGDGGVLLGVHQEVEAIRPHTVSTVLALLFATGLRISEALALRMGDVTPDGLVIRGTKFGKTRLVPLHPSAVFGMARYLDRRRGVAGGEEQAAERVR